MGHARLPCASTTDRGRPARGDGRLPGRLRVPGRWLLSGGALCCLLVSPAFADLWYEHYAKGESLLRNKAWQEAIQEFTQAIEKRPQPGAQVKTYGMNFIKYYPYLNLGIAYYNVGQFDTALKYFETEESFRAIGGSASDLGNLQAYRRLATEAQASTEADRLERLVEGGIQEARTLRQQGRLDDAISALGKALAASPDHAEANRLLAELREAVAGEQVRRDRDSRRARLRQSGESMMAAGRFEESSAAFQQALELSPDDAGLRELLERSQESLRGQIEAARSGPSPVPPIGLDAIGRLEREGRLDEALRGVQTILAVDPRSAGAQAAQQRLLKVQAALQDKQFRTEEIAKLLEAGTALLQKGAYLDAVARFNRVIALDPANASASDYLVRALKAQNETLMRGGVVAELKLPPSIVIPAPVAVVSRPIGIDGAGVELEETASPNFQLRAVILDEQPRVRVAISVEPIPHQGNAPLPLEKTLESQGKIGDKYRFDLNHPVDLREGPSALKIVAVDQDGLAMEETRRVLYVRPLGRRPWPYAAAGLAAVAVVATAQFMRIRRRRRLLERRFNPYVAGAPVLDDDLFVGREALLSRILQTIHNNSILLYGERRIGKTTLQHHLRRRLQRVQDEEYDFYPVYVDLQGTPQERFFATLGEDILGELGPLLNGTGLRPPDREDGPYDYGQFVRDVKQVLGALRARSAKRVKMVLLIDEVDELNNYDPRINQKLRSLFMKSFAEDMVAVVSGVGIKKHWASEGSPWYNFFEEIEVKPFTRRDAEELIEKPVRGIFKYGPGTVSRIIERTGCKPYLIQKMCVELINRMHDQKRRIITVADVDTVGRPAET